MQVQTTYSTQPTAGTSGADSSGGSAVGTAKAPTESMFLQLLIAQMKNQDPSSPQDPTQFVGQLAQFSELESVLNIQKDTDALAKNATPPPAGNSGN